MAAAAADRTATVSPPAMMQESPNLGALPPQHVVFSRAPRQGSLPPQVYTPPMSMLPPPSTVGADAAAGVSASLLLGSAIVPLSGAPRRSSSNQDMGLSPSSSVPATPGGAGTDAEAMQRARSLADGVTSIDLNLVSAGPSTANFSPPPLQPVHAAASATQQRQQHHPHPHQLVSEHHQLLRHGAATNTIAAPSPPAALSGVQPPSQPQQQLPLNVSSTSSRDMMTMETMRAMLSNCLFVLEDMMQQRGSGGGVGAAVPPTPAMSHSPAHLLQPRHSTTSVVNSRAASSIGLNRPSAHGSRTSMFPSDQPPSLPPQPPAYPGVGDASSSSGGEDDATVPVVTAAPAKQAAPPRERFSVSVDLLGANAPSPVIVATASVAALGASDEERRKGSSASLLGIAGNAAAAAAAGYGMQQPPRTSTRRRRNHATTPIANAAPTAGYSSAAAAAAAAAEFSRSAPMHSSLTTAPPSAVIPGLNAAAPAAAAAGSVTTAMLMTSFGGNNSAAPLISPLAFNTSSTTHYGAAATAGATAPATEEANAGSGSGSGTTAAAATNARAANERRKNNKVGWQPHYDMQPLPPPSGEDHGALPDGASSVGRSLRLLNQEAGDTTTAETTTPTTAAAAGSFRRIKPAEDGGAATSLAGSRRMSMRERKEQLVVPRRRSGPGAIVADDGDSSATTDHDSPGHPKSGGARVAAALQRRLETHRLLASSPIATLLDAFYVVFTLAIGIVTTLYIAFNWKRNVNDVLDVRALVIVVVISQVYSLIWFASRFVIQTRRGEWEIIDSVGDIARHYRSTWLVYDLICVVPVEFIFIGWAQDIFFWAEVRHLLRVVRLISLVRSGNPLHERRHWMALLIFVSVVVFFIHGAALVFMNIEDKQIDPEKNLPKGIDYADALYWASMTLTSVGYGDVLPSAIDGHRIYACLVMFSGVAMVSSLTAFVTSFLTASDALQDEIRERKQMLASMIQHYRIPWEVQVEIIALLPTALSAENEQKFTQLVSKMPAFMVERIEGYTRAKALSTSIPLFTELPVSVVLELTAKLQQRFYQANEVIIEIGEDGNEMFFMVTGLAEVVVPIGAEQELVVAVLRGGSFFGEMALVQDIKRTASVIAVSLCELLVLSKADFTELITKHAELQRIFLGEVFARHNVTTLIKKDADVILNANNASMSGEKFALFELVTSAEESQPRTPTLPLPQPPGVPRVNSTYSNTYNMSPPVGHRSTNSTLAPAHSGSTGAGVVGASSMGSGGGFSNPFEMPHPDSDDDDAAVLHHTEPEAAAPAFAPV